MAQAQRRARRTKRAALAAAACLCAIAAGAAPAHAAPEPGDFRENDAGGFRNILPPGTNGHVSLAELFAFQATGERPPHNHDQYDMYVDLVYEPREGFGGAELRQYFKDASFGVRPGDVERTYSPRDDVTIVRDAGFGVPHIYGETRDGAMFGAGYVSAEDRLFFMDILRHAGRAKLSSFIGGSQAPMDRSVWRDTPYNESELQAQYDLADEVYGAEGASLADDVDDYVAGVNQYITEACVNPDKMPGEYTAIGKPNWPCAHPWEVTDVIATASLVAGIFGKGGGREVNSALVLEQARERFGRRAGHRVWSDFRSAHDPERPTTVRGERFPYERVPKRTPGLALPDPETTQVEPVVAQSTPGSSQGAAADVPEALEDYPEVGNLLEALRGHSGGSNALLVSARESEGGRPAAVMGPQVSYFAPQILMEFGIHAPGSPDGPPIDAQGASFLGTNLLVQLGRGRDYAWSATSAGQDIIDTFAVRLCEEDGSEPTLDSQAYRYRGECKPFEVLERTNAWTPNAADQTPPGGETLRARRSDVGIVTHRAMIDGKPHAYTRLRVTYFHEVDSSLGFADFNNPRRMDSPAEFMDAACRIDYTFNWFYADEGRIAYFNSGANPVRSRLSHPSLPNFAGRKYEWRDWEPYEPGGDGLAFSDRLPCSQRPQTVDQRYLTSWNNAQAPGYRAADDNYAYQSVYRDFPLNQRIRQEIRGPRKVSLPELVAAMEDAGTVDLRGDQVLPWMLRVVESRPVRDAELAAAVETLREWSRSGAHRRDSDRDGTYDDAEAVKLMDAWWPRAVKRQFKPELGQALFTRVRGMVSLDDSPHKPAANQGSAYNGGWYGYVHKDLRTLLGEPVRGRYSRVYCGGGRLGACRKALRHSLKRAIDVPYSQVYADADDCEGGDPQWCYDAVESVATGGTTQPPFHWINRPTFQQAVQIGR